MDSSNEVGAEALAELKAIVDRLRGPDGCPWDREQTPQSLRAYLLEEAHETAEAIDSPNPLDLCEELGDLLLNVFLQARIAEEEERFTLADVGRTISEKLVRRHPHVFGGETIGDPDAVRQRWDEIKAKEKGESDVERSAIRELPASLPQLNRAVRYGAMAAETGFDWPDPAGPLAKVQEEVEELREAAESADPAAIEAEIGDLLFATASLARHYGVDPETALRHALERFRTRFRHVEENRAPEADLEDLERLWQDAKRAEE